MYAVIESGGKQYRVQPGDIIQVEKLDGDVGASLKIDQVLFASDPVGEQAKIWVGKPYLSGASVDGQIVGQGRGEKVMIVKMKRRKGYRRTQGHRQFQTQILITAVSNGAGNASSLSADDKKLTLGKFYTNLAPKGPSTSPKTLGSRKRRIASFAPKSAQTGSAAPKKAAASAKAEVAGESKAAPKKKAPAKKKAE